MRHSTRRYLFFVLSLISVALLWAHAATYLSFITDGALISLQYAKRLLAGYGLTWSSGSRVEGYSNLLWLLAVAGIGASGIDLIDAARIAGVTGMTAATLALCYAFRPSRSKSLVAPIAASGLFSFSGVIAAWTVGGLEQPFVAMFVAWGTVLAVEAVDHDRSNRVHYGGIFLAGVSFALLAITRPDGILFPVGCAAALIVCAPTLREGLVRGIILLSLPVVFFAGHTVFRLLYYGEWLPNTAYVKLGTSLDYLALGLRYVWRATVPHVGLALLALGGAAAGLRHTRYKFRTFACVIMLVLWLVYVVIIGGDLEPPSRHFVPAIVFLSILAGQYFDWIARYCKRSLQRELWIVTPFVVALYMLFQVIDIEYHQARLSRGVYDGHVIGSFLKKAFGKLRPLTAVDQAGWPPYFSDLPTIDMIGLNDYYIPRLSRTKPGEGFTGLGIGAGDSVLRRQPDLIIFCSPKGAEHACFPSGIQMQEENKFYERYTLAHFEGRVPYRVQTRLWIRRDGVLGIRRNEVNDTINVNVPVYLFESPSNLPTVLDSREKLVRRLLPEYTLSFGQLHLGAGAWSLEIIAKDEAPMSVVLTSEDREISGVTPLSFKLLKPRTIDMTLEATTALPLEGIRLQGNVPMIQKTQSNIPTAN